MTSARQKLESKTLDIRLRVSPTEKKVLTDALSQFNSATGSNLVLSEYVRRCLEVGNHRLISFQIEGNAKHVATQSQKERAAAIEELRSLLKILES
jgi:hypothetical protein